MNIKHNVKITDNCLSEFKSAKIMTQMQHIPNEDMTLVYKMTKHGKGVIDEMHTVLRILKFVNNKTK